MRFPSVKIISNNNIQDVNLLSSILDKYKIINTIQDYDINVSQKTCLIRVEEIYDRALWKLQDLEKGMNLNFFYNSINTKQEFLDLYSPIDWEPEWNINFELDYKDWLVYPGAKKKCNYFTFDEIKLTTEIIYNLWETDNDLLEMYTHALIPTFKHLQIQKMLLIYSTRKTMHLEMLSQFKDTFKLHDDRKYNDRRPWAAPDTLCGIISFMIRVVLDEKERSKEAINCLTILNKQGKLNQLSTYINLRKKDILIQETIMNKFIDIFIKQYPFLDEELRFETNQHTDFIDYRSKCFLNSLRGVNIVGLTLPKVYNLSMYMKDSSESLNETSNDENSKIV